MDVLIEFAKDVWLMPGGDVRMYGIPFQTRATIIRLRNGGLWVHSPVIPGDRHVQAVRALGPVQHLVAPNKIHSLGIAPWKARFPEAKVWLSPGFQQRHPRAQGDHVLRDGAPPEWGGEIDALVFKGSAFLDEVVFFHRASRSVLVTDLIQKHDPAAQSWFWSAVKKSVGVLGPSGGSSRDLRATFVDRAAARRSRDDVVAWEPDNLILCHGACIKGGATRAIAEAFAWLGP